MGKWDKVVWLWKILKTGGGLAKSKLIGGITNISAIWSSGLKTWGSIMLVVIAGNWAALTAAAASPLSISAWIGVAVSIGHNLGTSVQTVISNLLEIPSLTWTDRGAAIWAMVVAVAHIVTYFRAWFLFDEFDGGKDLPTIHKIRNSLIVFGLLMILAEGKIPVDQFMSALGNLPNIADLSQLSPFAEPVVNETTNQTANASGIG